MRSRYSAFVVEDSEYLRRSWHPDYCPDDLAPDPGIRWLGLEILASDAAGDRARVEFEARFLAAGRVDAIHERSDFLCVDGRWLYTRGEMLKPRFEAWRPGRNQTCPCGSGRKFKRCCAKS